MGRRTLAQYAPIIPACEIQSPYVAVALAWVAVRTTMTPIGMNISYRKHGDVYVLSTN